MDNLITALLFINPHSRMGANADLHEGIQLLEQAGIRLVLTSTSTTNNIEQLIEDHHKQLNLVIIGGGDGTINAAAPALFRYKLPFAILPLGTANDLAHSLGMTNNLLDAFHNIINNHRHKINLGVINGRYFFNAANIGLGVKVTHELTPELKKKWGVFSYLQAILRALRNNRAFSARIDADGKHYRLRSIQIAVGNGRYYGGGNVVNERSTINDGILYLYSLPPLEMWELFMLGPSLRSGKVGNGNPGSRKIDNGKTDNGKQRQTEKTFSVTGRQITITTSSIREIHADGEPAGKTPVTFSVIPDAVEVICPGPEQPRSETAT